jgi:hypothetical protein
LDTLRTLQKTKLDWLLLPHSISYDPEDVIVEAKTKIDDYLEYREERLEQMKSAIEQKGKASKEDLYQILYGPKNLTGKLVLMANRNLDLQAEYLVRKGLVQESEPGVFSPLNPKL